MLDYWEGGVFPIVYCSVDYKEQNRPTNSVETTPMTKI